MKPTTYLALFLIVAGAVANVREILANHQEDGKRLAAFYLALADTVQRDAGQVLRDTADVREANRRAGLLMCQGTGLTGKYPGLSDAIESALTELVGLDNVPLDDAQRKQVVAAFRAIAWACGDA